MLRANLSHYISIIIFELMIDVKKLCKEKGLRMTEQRNIIADVITEMSTDGHPDVNEIFLFANKFLNNIRRRCTEYSFDHRIVKFFQRVR